MDLGLGGRRYLVTGASRGLGFAAARPLVTDTAGRLVAATRDRLGRVDGALISVGGPEPGTVLDTPEDAWRDGVEAVLLGPLRLVRALVPHLGAVAVIGFVLSTSARSPLPDLAVSNSLRPGLAMIAKQLADELAPRGIRVVGLLPAPSPPNSSSSARTPPAIRLAPAPAPRPASRWVGSASPPRSAGWPPSCSPPPPPTSPAPPSRWTPAG